MLLVGVVSRSPSESHERSEALAQLDSQRDAF